MTPRIARRSLLLLLGLSACAELVGFDSIPVDFSSRELRYRSYEPPVVTAEGGEGLVRVRAELSTPDPCQKLHATADRSGSDLALHVTIRSQRGICVAMVGAFEYDAILRSLPRGAYRLRVTHRFPDTGSPDPQTAFEGVVTVR